jgi:hypothetical protein
VTATYTFDIFASLDGYAAYGQDGDWGGYWGKQGPDLLDRRRSVYDDEQRMVLGATTFRGYLEMLGTTVDTSGVDDWESADEGDAGDGRVVDAARPRRLAGRDDRRR